MLLCHLLHTYCLPILLYGLEAVTISNANRQTLYVTWKTALYKIFKLNDEFFVVCAILSWYSAYILCL